jgi:hypothetical protein
VNIEQIVYAGIDLSRENLASGKPRISERGKTFPSGPRLFRWEMVLNLFNEVVP